MPQPRILLVEDCPTDGRQLVRDLTAKGFDIILECDGISAIQRVHRAPESFDAICLDLQLEAVLVRYTIAVLRVIGYRNPILTLTACDDPASHESAGTACLRRSHAAEELGAFVEQSRPAPRLTPPRGISSST